MTSEICKCGHPSSKHERVTWATTLGKCDHVSHNVSTHDDRPCSCRAFVAWPAVVPHSNVIGVIVDGEAHILPNAEEVVRSVLALVPKEPAAVESVDPREDLIAQGFASLVAIVGVLRAIGGFLRPEQQAALFEAERIIALAKVTE